MVESRRHASGISAMGQSTSQLDPPPDDEPTVKDLGSSNGKKGKKKSKKQTRRIEETLGDEEESARALLQLRGGLNVPDSAGQPSNDSFAASQQLITESSPVQPLRTSGSCDTTLQSVEHSEGYTESGKKAKKKKKKKKKKKRKNSKVFDQPESDQHKDIESYLHGVPPSTPPAQTDRVPTPLLGTSVQPSQHALDDVSTDDDAAELDEVFGTGFTGVGSRNSSPDIYSFSQQPPENPDQQDMMHPPYPLPSHTYTSPKASSKSKRRGTSKVSAAGGLNEAQVTGSDQVGQYVADLDFEMPGNFVNFEINAADPFGASRDLNLPIDPELHSMGALPPSVDLSVLAEDSQEHKQKRKRRSRDDSLPNPSKRRRLEELQSSNGEHVPLHARDTMPNDQENWQDRILPSCEDPYRQVSPELGTPFIRNIHNEPLEYLDSGAKPSKAASKGKNKRKSTDKSQAQEMKNKRNAQSERSLADIAQKGGSFSAGEIEKVEAFRDAYCDANRINYRHFNGLIQKPMRGDNQVLDLFNSLHEVLPYRPRLSVQKFARRRFHNYAARGTWTAEEDEELRRAVAEKGRSWTVVGEMIERMPGDCRDRWRNYLQNDEHRNHEQWTETELHNLAWAIIECLQLIKDERRRRREEKYGVDSHEVEDDSDQEAEDMKDLNWQAVSDRMGEHGGGRSRLQCSFKWGQVKTKDQSDLLNAIKRSRNYEAKRPQPTKNPWRQKRAARQVLNMKNGDRYAFLQAVLASRAPEEGNIPWKALGDDQFRAVWNVAEKKAAWDMIKMEIPGSASLDMYQVVNRSLEMLLSEGKDKLNERWDPKSSEDRDRQGDAESADQRPPKNAVKKRRSVKSKEFVEESDEELFVADPPNKRPNHNQYTTLPKSPEENEHDNMNNEVALSNADEDDGSKDDEGDEGVEHDSLFDGTDYQSEDEPEEDSNIDMKLEDQRKLLQYVKN